MRSKVEIMSDAVGWSYDGDEEKARRTNECLILEALIDLRDCLEEMVVLSRRELERKEQQ